MSRPLWLFAAFAIAVSACTVGGDAPPPADITTVPVIAGGGGADPADPGEEPPPASTTGAPTGYTPAFEPGACRFEEPIGRDVTCGFVTVPENRQIPDGNQVRLAVAIVAAEVGPTADDPIIYLDGGPGGESLDPLQFVFPEAFEPFAQTRDVVFFDQRGVGLSEPSLDCVEDLDLTYELLDQDLPNSRYIELQLDAVRRCHDRLVEQGVDLSQYNSATNAADVADIRIALGYDEVNLLGISYGTRLAQTVMRDHPEGIRSVVLDSVYTPDVDLAVSTPSNLDRALNVLFSGCAGSAECVELYPDLETRLFELLDQLEVAPVIVQATDFISGDDYDVIVDGSVLLGVVFQALYSDQLIPVLPQLVDELEDGSKATLAQLVSINLTNLPFLSLGMHLSVQCAEEVPFSDPVEVAAADDPFPEFGDYFETSPNVGPTVFQICEIWDVDGLDPIENEPVSSQIPTLVIAGEYDPITPPAWGERVTQTLRNSRFLLATGLGHGASLDSVCTSRVALAFIEDPTGSLDTSCFDDLSPPAWAGTQAAVVGFELVATQISAFGNVINTLQPDSWDDLQPGVYVRGATGVDQTALIIQPFPTSFSAEDLAGLIGVSFGGEDGLVAKDEVDGWMIWQTSMQGFTIDIAVKTFDEFHVLVGLITSELERDSLIEAIWEPVLRETAPG